MPKQITYLYDASDFVEIVRTTLNEYLGVAWETDVVSIVDNVLCNSVYGDRYKGEQILEAFLISRGFMADYETVLFTRKLHQFVDDEYLGRLRWLHQSIHYRFDPISYNLLLVCYDVYHDHRISSPKPYPPQEDARNEDGVPLSIIRKLRGIKNAN